MNYEDYDRNDFLVDDYFIKWVRNPDAQTEQFWKSWIEHHPEKKEMIEEARYIVASVQFEDDTLQEQEVSEIWNSIRPNAQSAKPSTHQPVYVPASFPWQRMAAVFGGLIILALLSLWIVKWQSVEQESMTQYATEYGQTKSIVLPDQSEVILNANSSLHFSHHWHPDSARQIWLDGEAYFSVVHQENDQEFIVHSRGIDIRVLGTEFNVNNRRSKVRVVLSTGKVTLKDQHQAVGEEIVMRPGELVEIEEGKGEYSRKEVKTELYTSWKGNKLVFDGTPLSDIAQLLEDNYGYQVSIKDASLAERQFKGSVSTDEIDKLLAQLGKIFNADIQKKGKQIFIQKRAE